MPRLLPALSSIPCLVALSLPAAAQLQFDGRYHHSRDRCGDRDTVIVAGDRTNIYGDCRLTQPTNLRGLHARAFDLVCPGEGGRTVSERVILSLGAEGGLLVVRNAGWSSFGRCP